MEKLLTEKEVSELLNISLPTLRSHRGLNTGIPYIKFDKAVRYRESDIKKYIEEHRVETSN